MDPQEQAAIAAIRTDLLELLERIDELGLALAGIHLSMAINCLQPDSIDCEPQQDWSSPER